MTFKIEETTNELTLNPSSPGFSGSKSYNAMQQGCCGWAGCGGIAGERIGDGRGEAAQITELVVDTSNH